MGAHSHLRRKCSKVIDLVVDPTISIATIYDDLTAAGLSPGLTAASDGVSPRPANLSVAYGCSARIAWLCWKFLAAKLGGSPGHESGCTRSTVPRLTGCLHARELTRLQPAVPTTAFVNSRLAKPADWLYRRNDNGTLAVAAADAHALNASRSDKSRSVCPTHQLEASLPSQLDSAAENSISVEQPIWVAYAFKRWLDARTAIPYGTERAILRAKRAYLSALRINCPQGSVTSKPVKTRKLRAKTI